ncbi:MAG: hypothetical protein VYE68_02585, partial [Acidobacteriota bacterium]|nr:hypothetical protein [Acidobacteriota bacterium]
PLIPLAPVEGARELGPGVIHTDSPARLSIRPSAATLPLTFIRSMENPGVEGRTVLLTEGDFVFHGQEGEIIDGRYRIVGLGLETVDLESIDGGGRQTLRLQEESSGVQ